MDRRTLIATTGAAVGGIGLAGCSGPSDGNGNESDANDELDWEGLEAEVGETPDSVELMDSRLVETEEGAAVVGTIRNTGVNPYSVLEVEVTLNDGDTVLGEWLDTTEEEINGLDAGETWRFVATFEGENVYDATGYTINVNADVEDPEGDGAGGGS
jgi:hypothetical protein